MAETLTLTGRLNEKDQRKLLNAAQGDSIGPTTLYYAGVTAPIIGAGVAIIARGTLENSNLLSTYWLTLLSTILAAMAGIVWYLIFVRWSKRHSDTILLHENFDKKIILEPCHITLKRERVETRIALCDISTITEKEGDILIKFASAAPIFIPKHWFEDGTVQPSDVLQLLKNRDTA